MMTEVEALQSEESTAPRGGSEGWIRGGLGWIGVDQGWINHTSSFLTSAKP